MPIFAVGGITPSQPGSPDQVKRFFYQPQFGGAGPLLHSLLEEVGGAQVDAAGPRSAATKQAAQKVGLVPTVELKGALDFFLGGTRRVNPAGADLRRDEKPSGERRLTPDIEELKDKAGQKIKGRVTEAWRADP